MMSARSNSLPLSNDQIRAVAPSVFAEDKHESRSSRYTYVPTINIVEGMRNEGFFPVSVMQSKTRDESRQDFTKHMIRFRQAGAVQVGDSLPELVLVNSHDGTSSYQLMAGIFRLVCSNGMIVKSADIADIRIHHKGNIVHDVLSGSHDLVKFLPEAMDRSQTMRSTALEYAQQQAFAKAALTLRFDAEQAPVQPEQILRPRRTDDTDKNLWNTLNVVQENIIQGGLRGKSASGRRQRTREVKSVGENVRLNTALWTLAEEMQRLVALN